MIEKRDLYLVGLAGLLVAFHFYTSGKQAVALKSTRDSLSVVVKQSKAIQEQRDSVSAQLIIAERKSSATRTVYVRDSGKVALHGDTAVTKDFSQVLLPEVADRLRAADAHIASLEAENASLKFALKTDSTLIANQAEQIRLNQNIAKMVEGPKCARTCGIVMGISGTIGAAYVASLFRK